MAQGCGIFAIIIVFVVVIVGGGFAIEAAGYQWYMPWRANKQTEVIRNTNQYVTTQQEAILDALNRYNDPNANDVQKNAAVVDMCRAANRIDDGYVPESAQPIMRQRGCWN